MVQPPIIGGDRGNWGQKLLDWVNYKTDGLATDASIDALAAQVSGNIAAIEAIDGFLEGMPTAEEAARVIPPTAGTEGDDYRVTPSGPHFRDPDSVCPLDHGAVGDGTTDDYAAIMAAYTRLGPRGGRMDFAGKSYRCNTTLTFDKPVVLDGAVSGAIPGQQLARNGGEIRFADDLPGVVFALGSPGWAIRNMNIRGGGTTDIGAHGVETTEGSWSIENSQIGGFAGHGFFGNGDSAVDPDLNCNGGVMRQVRLYGNKGNGVHMYGEDANVCHFERVSAVFNAGYGIYDDSFGRNSYMNCLGDGNTLGDFYDTANGNVWIDPYSEGSSTFIIGATGRNGIILSGGVFGFPNIIAENNSGVIQTTAYFAVQSRDWVIWDQGKLIRHLRIQAPLGNRLWSLSTDTPSDGNLMIYDQTSANRLMWFRGSTNPLITAEQDINLVAGKVIRLGNATSGAALQSGAGSPEGAVAGRIGSIYMRTDGGAGTCMYVKESGTGTTGWVAK